MLFKYILLFFVSFHMCGSPIARSVWFFILMTKNMDDFMFAQNILLSTHFVAFSVTEKRIDQTKQLWYGHMLWKLDSEVFTHH